MEQGIFFSKDRKEEVIEVDEEPEFVILPDISERVRLITRGEWMKGCPEGSEQSFLFTLAAELSEGVCVCPHCGDSHITRQKSDFFALYVRQLRSNATFSITAMLHLARVLHLHPTAS